ncbi:MTMR9 [Acanthosepion pharaonis]|uniref:MTMR9 n=1 Tax=Acanthosepion pharaonis TaxID=158019 RepID=A0A812ERB6_ACAPH|nr:MTMR9 [Sepia pharaonis]
MQSILKEEAFSFSLVELSNHFVYRKKPVLSGMEFAEFIKSPTVDNVILHKPFEFPVEGTLCVTGFHLVLSSRQKRKEELWRLHQSIDSIEKKLSGAGGTLTIRCKDFSVIQMDIPSAEACINIASSVEQLSNIDDVALLYPFFYRPLFDILEDGWQAFLPQEEFNRFKECSDEWRLSYINKDYEVCPSYPHAVIVPKSVDDTTLIRVAGFRQYGRFPVLCYYHRDTKAVMMRSSQPMTGTNGRRCKDDERLVNAVLGIGRRGYILDTRSQNNAKIAQTKGGGFEPEVHYSQWRRINQAIDRRHVLHESLIKLIEACTDTTATTDKWLSKLDSSGWLSNVKDVINAACMAAQFIDKEGASVLVHGSEGLDTTLQVTSLAQLLLDHDCRTVRGFEALVEREWLQAGHPFQDRCVKSAFAVTKQRKEAPVFLLFLDCVWQIWQQFPCSFEFNEDFLLLLFQHSYSSQFGTFLCNNEFERRNHELALKTVSLWSYVNRPEIIQKYMNPMYEPNQSVLWPSVAPQSLTLWSALYCRSVMDNGPKEEAWEEMTRIQEYDKELRSRVNRLRSLYYFLCHGTKEPKAT